MLGLGLVLRLVPDPSMVLLRDGCPLASVVMWCLQVNGVCMEGKQHSDVVAAIKASGDETRLLVVDILTDEFFKKCKVVPSEQHLTGGLGIVLLGGVCATSAGSVSPSHQI